MGQMRADQLANQLESIISHRHGLISLPGPHPDLALDKSADLAAAEIIDHIHSILFSE